MFAKKIEYEAIYNYLRKEKTIVVSHGKKMGLVVNRVGEVWGLGLGSGYGVHDGRKKEGKAYWLLSKCGSWENNEA